MFHAAVALDAVAMVGLALTTAPGPQVVADHGRAQSVDVGHHHPTLDTPRDLVDESGQAGVTAQPEDGDLRAQPGHVVEPAHGVGDGARVRWVVEKHRRTVAVEVLEVSGRLAVGHHQNHGLCVGMPPQMPSRQRKRVMQVGALLVDALQTGELSGRHRPRVTAKGDDLQRIRTKPGAHQVVERECRLLHRQPAILHHHRERGVHQQRDRRLGAGLGL